MEIKTKTTGFVYYYYLLVFFVSCTSSFPQTLHQTCKVLLTTVNTWSNLSGLSSPGDRRVYLLWFGLVQVDGQLSSWDHPLPSSHYFPLLLFCFCPFLGSYIFLFLGFLSHFVGIHPSVTCWEGSGSDLKLAVCNCLPNCPIFIKTCHSVL